MDIPDNILEELKCTNCQVYLSRGPVYLQFNSEAVCSQCYAPERPAVRNKQYEATAKLLKFPCKFQKFGCVATVPFAEHNENIAHEETCDKRQHACPVLGSASCHWLGMETDVLAHCRDEHPERILDNPCALLHDLTKASEDKYLVTAFQLLFILHTKICLATEKIFHSLHLHGATEDASNYFFNLVISRRNEQLSKEGQALTLDMNVLRDVLDGLDGTTFTLTVKQKIKRRMSNAIEPSRPIKQLKTDGVICVWCKIQVPDFRYRDADGWRCENCAPAKRCCKHQGCTFTDFDNKCKKHEWFFCQKRTSCKICKVRLSRRTLSTHYVSKHRYITHSSDSKWRAIQTENWRYCLLSSAAGTAVCTFKLTESKLVLYMSMPVTGAQLKEFRCGVRVSDPVTGHARTYTPDAMYNQLYDWRIVVEKEDFMSWNKMLDVSVYYNKIN